MALVALLIALAWLSGSLIPLYVGIGLIALNALFEARR